MTESALPPSDPTPRVESLPVLGRLLRRFAPHKAAALGVFGLLLLRSGFEIAFPLLVAAVIDDLAPLAGRGGALPGGFVALLVALGGVMVLRNVFLYAAQVSAASLGQTLENELRSDLFRHVLALRFRYHDENRSGKTIARSLRDMEKARHFFREVWFGYLEVGLLAARGPAGRLPDPLDLRPRRRSSPSGSARGLRPRRAPDRRAWTARCRTSTTT